MSGRNDNERRHSVPGPGTYTPKSIPKKIAPSYGMGSAAKGVDDMTTRRFVPGPGSYKYYDASAEKKGIV